jgi:manganese/zinc/iron transport system substrate-binding protein
MVGAVPLQTWRRSQLLASGAAMNRYMEKLMMRQMQVSVSRGGWSAARCCMVLCMSVMATVLGGCDRAASGTNAGGSPGTQTGPLRVVATTGMIADAARIVAGERAVVTALMGPGVDPHIYKATPADVRVLSEADVILYNGLHLEGRINDTLERLAGTKAVVQVTDTLGPSGKLISLAEEGAAATDDGAKQFDPHVWFDVAMWSQVVRRVGAALSERDPQSAPQFAAAAEQYARVLADVHAYAIATLNTIPADRRVLVSAHDAFSYFGRAYGLEVLAIQGISTDSEASLRDINALVDLLVSRKIPAVFVESSVPRKTIEALVEGCRARGHEVRIGGELFSDALGERGTPEATYVGMMLHNIEAVTRALGGQVPAQRPQAIEAFMQVHAGEGAPRPGASSR